MRTGFAALDDSIADEAANGKGVGRANEALERANFARKTGIWAQIGADRGVHRACVACVTRASRRAKTSPGQSDISDEIENPCHIADFPGVFGFSASKNSLGPM